MVDMERVVTLDELMDRVPEDLVKDAESRRTETQEQYHSSAIESHNGMSKGPSKAKRIREYLDNNPEARNKDVVEALSQHGVTAADVANVKSIAKRSEESGAKREPGQRGRPTTKAAGSASNAVTAPGANITLPELEAGVAFVRASGSVMRAKHLLIIIEQIKAC